MVKVPCKTYTVLLLLLLLESATLIILACVVNTPSFANAARILGMLLSPEASVECVTKRSKR